MLVTGVEGSKYALGYFGFAYYEENKDRLKLLGIDAGDGIAFSHRIETVRRTRTSRCRDRCISM